ncbi:transketolase C-terminal domain-containing protein [Gemmatimonadota bacterium]
MHESSPQPGPESALPTTGPLVADLTIVTYGMMVHRSLDAARTLQGESGVEVEVLDLRSPIPVPWRTISSPR